MNWTDLKKLGANAATSYGSLFVGALMLGVPPKTAAILAGVSMAANYAGLSQEQIKLLSTLLGKK